MLAETQRFNGVVERVIKLLTTCILCFSLSARITVNTLINSLSFFSATTVWRKVEDTQIATKIQEKYSMASIHARNCQYNKHRYTYHVLVRTKDKNHTFIIFRFLIMNVCTLYNPFILCTLYFIQYNFD